MSSIMMIDIPNALEVVERKKSTWSIFPPFSIVSNHPSSSPPVKIPSFPSLVFSEINFHCEQSSTILIFRSHIKHRKSAKLPWHHNIKLSLFVFLSFCVHITLIKCLKDLKAQKSLFVSKVLSGTDWLTDPPRVGIELPAQLKLVSM